METFMTQWHSLETSADTRPQSKPFVWDSFDTCPQLRKINWQTTLIVTHLTQTLNWNFEGTSPQAKLNDTTLHFTKPKRHFFPKRKIKALSHNLPPPQPLLAPGHVHSLSLSHTEKNHWYNRWNRNNIKHSFIKDVSGKKSCWGSHHTSLPMACYLKT